MRRYGWDALCPGCLSLSRHLLLWLDLRGETDLLRRPQAVLHFAPRRGDRAAPRGCPFTLRSGRHPSALADVTRVDITCDSVRGRGVRRHPLQPRTRARRRRSQGRGGLTAYSHSGGPLVHAFNRRGWGRKRRSGTPGSRRPRRRRERFGQRDHVRLYGRDSLQTVSRARGSSSA